MNFRKKIILNTAADTEAIAEKIATLVSAPALIFLEGDLGAGKTTFAKGFFRALGYDGLVKSPTYTLIETYPLEKILLLHADFFRLKDPHELEMLGLYDYLQHEQIIGLIEWPNKMRRHLPEPLILCKLTAFSDKEGRLLEIQYQCKALEKCIDALG